MSNASLISGKGDGYAASVDSVGRLLTQDNGPRTVYTSLGVAGTTSAEILPARSGRTGLVIQVQGANTVSFKFADVAAVNTDFQIVTGDTFTLPADNPYEGPVNAIAPGGNTNVRFLEFAD